MEIGSCFEFFGATSVTLIVATPGASAVNRNVASGPEPFTPPAPGRRERLMVASPASLRISIGAFTLPGSVASSCPGVMLFSRSNRGSHFSFTGTEKTSWALLICSVAITGDPVKTDDAGALNVTFGDPPGDCWAAGGCVAGGCGAGTSGVVGGTAPGAFSVGDAFCPGAPVECCGPAWSR